MIDAQFAAYEARCTKAAALATEILPHNKQVLFDALSAAGIDLVTVEFDGSGDSGQFEAPAGFDAENTEVAIPAGEITVKVVDFETGTIREQTTRGSGSSGTETAFQLSSSMMVGSRSGRSSPRAIWSGRMKA